jgi:polyhydroxybutyrate depolymerase
MNPPLPVSAMGRPPWRAVLAVALSASIAAAIALLSGGRSGSGAPLGGASSSASASSRVPHAAAGAHAAAALAPIVYVPPNLPPGRVPLLVVLHGTGGTPAGMEATTGFDQLARAHGFVVAYLASRSPGGNWILPSDTAYVGATIQQMEASEPVDPARVYVTGFSAGGYESYRVGCMLSDEVAAVAPVAVSMNGLLYRTCRLSRPVSALIVIGSADTEHYGGFGRLPSAPQAAARWRALDGCPAGAPALAQAPGPAIQQTWRGCADGSAVGLTIVEGGTHIWPGPRLGPATPDGRYDASPAIWAFFAAHRAGSLRAPDARVASVSLARGTGRLAIALRAGESLTARVTVARAGRALARARRALPSGRPRLVLQLPSRPGGVSYRVRVVLADVYGRTLALSRTVRAAG